MPFLPDYAGALGSARTNYRKERQFAQDQKDAAVARSTRDKNIELLDDKVAQSAITTDNFADNAAADLASKDLRNREQTVRTESAEALADSDTASKLATNELTEKQAKSDSTLVKAKETMTRTMTEAQTQMAELQKLATEGKIDVQGMENNTQFMDTYSQLVDSTALVARTDPKSAAKAIAEFDLDGKNGPDVPAASDVRFETKTDDKGESYEEMVVLNPEGGVAFDTRKNGEARYDMRELDNLRNQVAKNKKAGVGGKAPKPITPEQTAKIDSFADKTFRAAMGGRNTDDERTITSDDPNELGYHKEFVQQTWTGAVEQRMRESSVGAGEARKHFRGNAGIIMALTGTTRKRAEQIINDESLGETVQERLVYAIQRVQNLGKGQDTPPQQ